MRQEKLMFLLLLLLICSGCEDGSRSSQQTICGVYTYRGLDKSIRHGADILVLNRDFTYSHVYTKGSSGKDLVQSGTWTSYGSDVVFHGFVSWDLLGPESQGVRYPDPATTSFPLGTMNGGQYEIDVGPDRSQQFIQIETCQ
jgi:hypothetical protein